MLLVLAGACRDSRSDLFPSAPQPRVAGAEDPSDEFYYYQGQKIFLDVDATRIVVETRTPDRAAEPLRGLGIGLLRSERLEAAPDHWLLRLAGAAPEKARAAVAMLRADRGFGFASNVYRTRDGGHDVVPLDRVIVNFRAGVGAPRIDSLVRALGLRTLRTPKLEYGFTYYVFQYPRDSASALRVAALLDRHPLVAWADPDKITDRHVTSVPSDAYYPLQYYLKNTVVRNGVTVDDNVEQAWDLTTGAWAPSTGGLRVGVVGEGVEAAHPEFDGHVLTGYDGATCTGGCPDNETRPYVLDYHETMAAGIIAGQHNNGGIAGIAPGVLIVPGRVIRNGQWQGDLAAADVFNYLWQFAGAQVISNSWGGGAPTNTLTNAIVTANTQGRGGKGTVVVFSAGNTSRRGSGVIGALEYPATLAEVVAVGAIDRNGDLTDYTPEGPELDIVAMSGHWGGACNGDVVTTNLTAGTICRDGPNGDNLYTTHFTGTSAAAPQVAAVAALVIARSPNLTGQAVKDKLYSTAVRWGPATQYGAGKLNAFGSVMNVVVTVSGYTTIKLPGNYTWTASATGGNGTYSYTWERASGSGPYSVVGSGPSYSEYVDAYSGPTFSLRVTATSGAEFGQAIKKVNVLIPQ